MEIKETNIIIAIINEMTRDGKYLVVMFASSCLLDPEVNNSSGVDKAKIF